VSAHAAFRRQPVPGQFAQQLKAITIPAPTRGIIQSENDAFMGPGSCIISDNWFPTMKGVRLRGGTVRHCDLHALDATAWQNNHAYAIGVSAFDLDQSTLWIATTAHTSAASGTFAANRAGAAAGFWTNMSYVIDQDRKPVVSGFNYVSGLTQKMFAGQQTKLFDVTGTLPVLVKSGQTSGNYVAAQMTNLSGDYLLVCNESGDPVLRFDGTTWLTLTTEITGGPVPGTATNLTYVCKYRNRLYFIEKLSMNMWYLPIDSIQGALTKIPMSGAASKGGYLKFLAVWSVDAGDGIDDKLVAYTSEGEALIFTGNNPADPLTWKQEGRYYVGQPMGMNAHGTIGGDLLILTVEGIVPLSQALQKTSGELELAMISRNIKRMWREEVAARFAHPWTMFRWDEFGGIFVTFPGGQPGNRYALAMNSATGAFARAVGWDAMCFLHMHTEMYFGTQAGFIMQAEVSGFDDGNHTKVPYVATLVGGWEMLQARAQMTHMRQARAVFTARAMEPFIPQLDATVDYIVTIPPPPQPGEDLGTYDVWDQGLWDHAKWDQKTVTNPMNQNTMWVSIGKTGFSHAPIVQVSVAQKIKPAVELVAVHAIFEQGGVNV